MQFAVRSWTWYDYVCTRGQQGASDCKLCARRYQNMQMCKYIHTYMHRAPFSACIYGGPEVDRMVFSRTVMEQVSNLSMYVCICTCSVRSCHERGQCVLPCMNADSHAVCRQGSPRTVITVHHQTHSFEQALSQKAWAAGTYIHRSIVCSMGVYICGSHVV